MTEESQSVESVGQSTGASTESTSTNQTANTDQNSVEVKTGSAEGSEQIAAPVTPGPEGTKYTPNYKYKIAGEEKEVDEFFRALIKDEASEKKLKDYLTKLDGFDYIKTRKEETTKELESVRADYTALTGDVSRVLDARDKGDLGSVFRQLRIMPQAVLQWANEYLNMTPDQLAMQERQVKAQEQEMVYQQHLSTMQKQVQEQAIQTRTMQMQMVMSREDVAPIARAWDERVGTPGSFWNLVKDEGIRAFYEEKKDITPDEAASRVMKKFGVFVTPNEAQPQVSTSLTPQGQPAPQGPKPVIPTVKGRGASPIKRAPRNLDELKKIAREM